MQKRFRLIPFSFIPYYWGVSDDVRQVEYLKYYYSGYDCDIAVNNIKNADDELERNRQRILIDHRHGHIGDFEKDMQLVDFKFNKGTFENEEAKIAVRHNHGKLTSDEFKRANLRNSKDFGHIKDVEYRKEILELDYKDGKVSQREYEKQLATLNDKPYFQVISGTYVPSDDGNGRMIFELDWNDQHVRELKKNGWKGETPDLMVDAWFEDCCRQMAGIDDFEDDEPYPRSENLGDGIVKVN